MSQKAIFLDRDGTLIEHIPYLTDPNKVTLLPGVGEAIRRAREQGFLAILITNQSAIARGLLTERQLHKLHKRLCQLLNREKADLDGIFFCPHHPVDNCSCRKPKPGMILNAAQSHKVNIQNSFMIGDEWKDVEAGQSAGCRTILMALVPGTAGMPFVPGTNATFSAESLPQAIDWILQRTQEDYSSRKHPHKKRAIPTTEQPEI